MALINLRNALMSDKRLPYDAEVEYLESTGTQYIDTGVIPDDTTGYFVRCSVDSVGGNKVPCGQRENSGNTRWCVNFSSNLEFSWNAYRAVGTYNANTWYDIGFNWLNSRTGTKDGSTVFNISQQLTTRTRTAYAFANCGLTMAVNLFAGKIASLKISQGASLVRDFIPVRKGTVGYLYDRVSGKLFGNAGTGDFVLGPDVVPVEYIESHGTEYIDTGVVWNRAMTVSATLAGLQSTTFPLQSLFGARNTNTANAGYSFGFNSSNKFVSDNSGSRATSSMNYVQGDVYTVVKNLSGCSITNAAGTTENLVNNAGTQTATYNLLLFALNNIGTAVITKSRFYGCKIWDANGVLVRSFRPVRVGTDATSWEGAMMDVLTRRIYRNAGTGAFTYGNDLKYPIPA